MELSIWWVVIAAYAGLCAGVFVTALLTMSSKCETDSYLDLGDTRPVDM
jgi:hypothetical protein